MRCAAYVEEFQKGDQVGIYHCVRKDTHRDHRSLVQSSSSYFRWRGGLTGERTDDYIGKHTKEYIEDRVAQRQRRQA